MHVTAFSSKASYLQNQRRRGKRACRGPSVGVRTMKKILFATVTLLVVGAAAPAVGADLGARPYYNKAAPAYAAPIYNWTGFYIGAHVGGAFSSDNNFNGLSTGNNGNGRFLGGVQTAFVIAGDHRNGYTVGAGLAYMFAPNWSAKAEYQYYNFGDAHFTGGPLAGTGKFTTDDHTIKAGVNYRFNWANSTVARY